jgi:hypothetical protein
MEQLVGFVGLSSDVELLVAGALITAALALVIGRISRALLFSRRGEALEAHGKLAEVVHNSLLAFSVFVLALVLAEVRANLSKAEDNALRESSVISRLRRDLTIIGGAEADAARLRLKDYVASATGEEWPLLGRHTPELSPRTDAAMSDLVRQVNAVAELNPGFASPLRSLLDKIEELRQTRLEAATKAVPVVFWWVMALFLLGAMVMNGRHRLDGFSAVMITFHMGAIGMVIGLIVIMDSPYRGETSVKPVALERAIRDQ